MSLVSGPLLSKWKVSMLVKWSPNSVTATRRFHGPSHPRLFGGAKALELSVPGPKPAAHRNYFRVLMLVIPFHTHVYTLRFWIMLEPTTI